MKWSFPAYAALLMSTLAASAAQAAEFKSVGANPAVLYNAPSERGRKIFIAPRGMPVEIILTQNGWSKVRDVAGDLAWIDASALSAKRNVIVTAANLKLHATAEENAAVVVTVDKGVLLELLAPPAAGWVKLKHRDGPSGFARIAEVWGE
ncbi:SH3 domain-containing protein [Herminiimonas fonticola]|uniref:SH3-like domain-containing protein n=1 Tax=Herminiimonas fonticola TaxID=303380 RepID=A0A4R6GI59_9BURK|nr:SH3 domain-containing protein [Herminiimonas fonticola]RBA24965.1 hypothetical protein Hfont_0598 [Herminiimonas fonticola]TDN94080.1 SH3-like domain-containing protein [Herminiimonas fonticola]